MQITEVHVLQVSGTVNSGTGRCSSTNTSVSPRGDRQTAAAYRSSPNHAGARLETPGGADVSARGTRASTYYVRVDAGEHFGLYGPVDRTAADLIVADLKGFLIGKDPRRISILWDQMYRHDRHARSSHPMMAISAVDNTLWDLLGRYHGVPVYELLGGPRATTVEAYASTLGTRLAQGPAEETADQLRSAGFSQQKWFLRYGPPEGMDGLRANIDLVRRLRSAVGEDVELSFDAFMRWDVPYTREWLRRTAEYRPYWLEEPLPADQMEAMIRLRKETGILLAAGEHLYGRWEAHRHLSSGGIDILQSDPEWCGGVSELIQICAAASLWGVPVIPHGHGVRAALHVVASRPPWICPKIEYLINQVPQKLYFERNIPLVANGMVELGLAPGFGIELDDSKIEGVVTL